MVARKVQVIDYNPAWPVLFRQLADSLLKALGDTAQSIEHVGSTAIPGLCAKPILDLDVVVEDEHRVSEAIRKLAAVGYRHRGELGVEGREAFHSPHANPEHHLYVCPANSLGLRNHLAVRCLLLEHEDLALEYGQLKRKLAERFPDNIDRYIDGKTDFLIKLLSRSGLSFDQLESIRHSNEL